MKTKLFLIALFVFLLNINIWGQDSVLVRARIDSYKPYIIIYDSIFACPICEAISKMDSLENEQFLEMYKMGWAGLPIKWGDAWATRVCCEKCKNIYIGRIMKRGERKYLTVCFVLDETGSMSDRKTETIDSFNEYLSALRDRKEDISMTLTKFNSGKIDVVFKKTDVDYVADLNNDTYNPNNMTPLYDAIGKTINRIKVKRREHILFVILTDGLENYSTEYSRKQIFNLIKDKECKGWTFVFLGADQDSYVAEQFGLQRGNILIWESSVGVSSPMQQLIKNTDAFLDAGAVQTSDFFNKDSVKVKEIK